MLNTTDASPKPSPFAALHEQFDGQMVDFAGWNLPIRYHSIIEEHHQVRKSGGFFDVSHMGRLYFDGPGAVSFLDRLCTRKIEGTAIGQCRYGILCNDAGGCRDDVIISRLDETRWLMVVNGANREKILGHIEDHRDGFDMTMDDRTDTTAMCALQGPKVMPFLGALLPQLAQLKRYRLMVQHIMGAEVILSRTGYTGEDGVELIMDATLAGQVLAMLGDQLGADATIQPCGLGARDTLRMEAGMPLYGHELSETLNPLAAGLGFAVKCDKGLDGSGAGPFIGQEKLAAEKAAPTARTLVGLDLEGRRSARQSMPVLIDGTTIGEVTSGCLSPTLDHPIAMAYLDAAHADATTNVEIDLGRKTVKATVRSLPFYKR